MRSRYQDHATIPTREIPDKPVSESVKASESLPVASCEPTGRLRRHWLTGEYEIAPYESPDGRSITVAGDRPCERVLARRDYNRVLIGASIPPEQATPERIARENTDAKKHNTGAYYTADGRCITTSRQSQNRELRRKNMQVNDAGYGDWAGR